MTGIIDKRLMGRAFDDKRRGINRGPVGGKATAQQKKMRPGLITYTNLPFTAATDTKNILPENPHRVYLAIQNQGTQDIYVAFGGPNGGLKIIPGTGFEWNINAPQNSVYVYTLAGSVACILIEGTR